MLKVLFASNAAVVLCSSYVNLPCTFGAGAQGTPALRPQFRPIVQP